MKTTVSAKPAEVRRDWFVVDAEGKNLGRLASEIALVLRGKNKPQYTPHVDTGDFVVVVNAGKVAVTGNKLEGKVYYRHSGRPGSLKSETVRERLAKKPEKVIEAAVWGMLPKNRLGRKLCRKLRVYEGAGHPHSAQSPEPLDL